MKNNTKILSILKNSIFFKNFDDNQIEKFLEISNSNILKIKKNEYIFFQEDTPRYLYILINGAVQIEKSDTNGKRMIMNRFDEAGSIFGEVYLYFPDKNYDYSCLCVESCQVLIIPRELFTQNLSNEFNYLITQNMLEILSKKVYFLNQKVIILSSFTLRQKIANYLLKRIKENSQNQTNIDLIFKREELADFIGTTRPSLSREMLSMQEDKIIELNKNTFKVLDYDRLESLI